MEILSEFFKIFWLTMLELSPSLLIGLLITGIIHAFISDEFFLYHTVDNSYKAIIKSILIGVPMPLCSCGVIPAAMGMKKKGASKSATTAFLISTPQTGVDSIMVSAAFLGWPFAVFKLLAAALTGLIGGMAVKIFISDKDNDSVKPSSKPAVFKKNIKISEIFRYGFTEILGGIYLWIIAGVTLSSLINLYIPEGYFSGNTFISGAGGLLLTLAISLPLYVCTTGSVPVAASMISSGLPGGSALVFLMAGPASNIATIVSVFKVLGKKTLTIYLATVIFFSLILALLFDSVIELKNHFSHAHSHHSADLLTLISTYIITASVIYLLLSGFFLKLKTYLRKKKSKSLSNIEVNVFGMTCNNCFKKIKTNLEKTDGISLAEPDIERNKVKISGTNLSQEVINKVIIESGFKTDE